MKWVECTEIRGRATLLNKEQELSLVKDIAYMLDKRCWLHWTLVCKWAEGIYVEVKTDDEVCGASTRLGFFTGVQVSFDAMG